MRLYQKVSQCKMFHIIFETKKNVYRQLLKIPRFGITEELSLKLLRAIRFSPKSFYFFFNRIARYAQSKES